MWPRPFGNGTAFKRIAVSRSPVLHRCALAVLLFTVCLLFAERAQAEVLRLPTANRVLFELGGEPHFYTPTPGRPWTSGSFGCVRTGGAQFHEGIDIQSIERDTRGEPIDPVWATADGVVMYINGRAGASNYGKYIVIRHLIHSLEVYSLYAHLREIRGGLKPGQAVRAGESIGVLGRTANTRQPISKDRAHLHFELNLIVNGRFSEWHKKTYQTDKNEHGIFHGQNLLGFDPAAVFLAQRREGDRFNLLTWFRDQPELCRVLVRAKDFPFPHRYAPLVLPNPVAAKEGIAGYEIAFSSAGVPFQLIPRAASEIPGAEKYQVVSVNESEQKNNPCRRFASRRGNGWELTSQATLLLDLLTFVP
jgi:peptidoglycan LD-endopeptidase LytH